VRIVAGHDHEVAAWAQDKYERGLRPYDAALAIVNKQEQIVGAATLHEFNGSNVELCYWGPNTLTRYIAGAIAYFCFRTIKANRITCRTPRWNKPVVRHLPKLGFKYEGLLRRYYGPDRKHDAIIFGLLLSDAERLLRNSA